MRTGLPNEVKATDSHDAEITLWKQIRLLRKRVESRKQHTRKTHLLSYTTRWFSKALFQRKQWTELASQTDTCPSRFLRGRLGRKVLSFSWF